MSWGKSHCNQSQGNVWGNCSFPNSAKRFYWKQSWIEANTCKISQIEEHRIRRTRVFVIGKQSDWQILANIFFSDDTKKGWTCHVNKLHSILCCAWPHAYSPLFSAERIICNPSQLLVYSDSLFLRKQRPHLCLTSLNTNHQLHQQKFGWFDLKIQPIFQSNARKVISGCIGCNQTQEIKHVKASYKGYHH